MTLLKTLAAGFVATTLMAGVVPANAHDDLKIVASFSILGDMVEQVVGDHAKVTTIVGPDADAHVYQPSVADARAVAESDVIFVNGLGFETWSETLISESGTEATVHVATEGVTPVMVDGETDPHAWNSLSNGVIYVRNIADALGKAMPDHADDFNANAEAYIAKLEALDKETRTRLATLPEDRRTVVTAHDAFGYLADAYGLTFLAPVGIDTEAEPSARDLAVLITQLKEQGAAALFVENITSPALVQQISDETGIEIGGRLFSDALSERGGPATSYLAMFEHNLGTLIEALGKKNNS
ncbi:metal ABC transporter substrate-binding protein [Roseibium porphyridii]|uniref:Metal ABC transporter substrate-binding protein n=1 Tax=Roseibium porphyridii TaxID=2866279 RepID=A0ABY8F175_9HYPH|nr:metal ABC transporter substrate-binding protein [Roseibium sp. KMA01]WFE89213.1 metal ABC transporter substrate-binding protein [Roseibium sp. KMA01]